MREQPFSDQLEEWLHSKDSKTLESLTAVFAEKSFAILILLLMFIPALPLPTGGITHVFELITILLALEMIAGQRTIWLPKRWRAIRLGSMLQGKAIPLIVRRIRWFERFSRPRLQGLVDHALFTRFAGIFLALFTVAAFVAPPFSGLDTLPALGAVVIALALILGDAAVFIIGIFLGALGTILVGALGAVTIKLLEHLF